MAYSGTPQNRLNIPTTPTYKMPTGNTNPAVPMAQRRTYADNPWDDPYVDFNKNAAGQAGAWNDKALAYDPMKAGGILSSPDAFKAGFDFNFPDINDRRTTADISKWGSVLDSSNAIQSAIDRIGNAGITRAGYGGVAGAEDPGAGMRRTAIQTAAGGYQDNVKTAMDYMQKKSAFNQQSAGMYLDAIAKAYGITTEMAAKMMGLNLEGIGRSDASRSDYMRSLSGEEGQNVGDYNRWQEGDAERNWAIKQRNQGAADQQFQRDQTAANLQGFKDTTSQLGKPSSSSGNQMDPAQQALMEYYGVKTGAWGKPNWESFKLTGGGGGGGKSGAKTTPELLNFGKAGYMSGYNDSDGAIWGVG
jgi:hypothetical protein